MIASVVAGACTQASLWPWAGSGFGSLPPLLVVMTVVTGIVDAVSYLALGHVFVANMTGNVVFLGFALAGAGGLSVPASLVALAAFLCGSTRGSFRRRRGKSLSVRTARTGRSRSRSACAAR